MLKGYTYCRAQCWAQRFNAGLDTGLIQKMCGAGSLPGPDFGEHLTSLFKTGVGVGKIFSTPTPAPAKTTDSDSECAALGQTTGREPIYRSTQFFILTSKLTR